MKILAIDYGEKRLGLAISDDEQKIAVAKGLLEGLSQNKIIQKIKALVSLDQIGLLVVGLPTGLDGTPTAWTEEVKRFTDKLRSHLSVPVQMVDERYTTSMAKGMLAGTGQVKAKKDMVAAQIFLQDYLDKQQLNNA